MYKICHCLSLCSSYGACRLTVVADLHAGSQGIHAMQSNSNCINWLSILMPPKYHLQALYTDYVQGVPHKVWHATLKEKSKIKDIRRAQQSSSLQREPIPFHPTQFQAIHSVWQYLLHKGNHKYTSFFVTRNIHIVYFVGCLNILQIHVLETL